MQEERVDADELIGAQQMRPVAPRHGRVLPSFLVREIRRPFQTWLGDIEADELLSWTRSVGPPSSVADDIRLNALGRLQPHKPELFREPCGVRLDPMWENGLDRDEVLKLRRALRHLGPDEHLEGLTLNVLKRYMGVPHVEVFKILAKLEAIYWSPSEAPPLRMNAWSEQPLQLRRIELVDALRAKVEQALALPWIERVQKFDMRLAGPFGVAPAAWLREQLDSKHGIAKELEATTERILAAASMTYAQEVESMVRLAVMNSKQRPRPEKFVRWLDIFMGRYVAKGSPPTLQQLGDARGVTRERIRQVCEGVLKVLRAAPLCKPALERVIRMAARAVPCSVAEADEQLARELGEGAGILGAMELAAELGDVDISVEMSKLRVRVSGKYEHAPVLESVTEVRWSQAALRYAAAECSVVGCTSVLRLAGHMAMKEGVALGREDLASVVTQAPGFEWLDERNGWFTVGATDRSGVAMRLRKVLSVAIEPVSVDEMAEAYACDTRLFKEEDGARAFAIPPTHVIQAMARRWPFVKLRQHTKLIATVPINPAEELTELEQLAVRIIEERGGVAPAFQFYEQAEATGVARITTSLLLASSPIIVRLEHGLYALRGRRQTDDALSAARKELTLKLGQQPAGLDPDVFRVAITDAALNRNEQYNVPSRFHDRLRGRVLRIEGSEHVARISMSGSMRGINRAFPSLCVGDELEVRCLEASLAFTVIKARPEATN